MVLAEHKTIRVGKNTGALRRFREAPPKFEQTYETSKEMERFTAAVMSLIKPKAEAQVILSQIVFEPKNLIELLRFNGISASEESLHQAEITANSFDIPCLLQAAWNDWVDFLFVAENSAISLFADHDEWTTIFASSQEELDSCTTLLDSANFKRVEGYIRF